jgi:hypothetical protein
MISWREIRGVKWKVWHSLAALMIIMLFIFVNSIWYANHAADRRSHDFCELVVTLDDAYKQLPPQTPIGKKLAVDMHRLRLKLKC